MTATPEERSRPRAYTVAIMAACLYGLILYGLARWSQPGTGLALFAFALGGPLATCCLAVYLADPYGQVSAGRHAGMGAVVVTAMMLGAGPVVREGLICVIMLSPIFYFFGCLAAVATGTALRGRKDNAADVFCSALIALPLIGIPLENAGWQRTDVVTVQDEVVVAATPDRVWAEAIEIRDIAPGELGFTVTQDLLRVPKPIGARLEGRGVGVVRHAQWGADVRFREHVTAWSPGRRMAWRFEVPVETQRAILDDHLDLDSAYLGLMDGAYTLTPLPDGRTRLSLATRYRLRTPMNGYLALWGRLFLGDIQSNVLGVVKGRAEAAA